MKHGKKATKKVMIKGQSRKIPPTIKGQNNQQNQFWTGNLKGL